MVFAESSYFIFSRFRPQLVLLNSDGRSRPLYTCDRAISYHMDSRACVLLLDCNVVNKEQQLVVINAGQTVKSRSLLRFVDVRCRCVVVGFYRGVFPVFLSVFLSGIRCRIF